MSKRALWYRATVTACVVAATSLALITAARAESRRLALVIGNAVYAQMPALETCASSANLVAAALKRAGFEVTQLANPSNGQMGAAISGFADAVAKGPDSIAVAYACGYAMAFDGRVFLLPASANLAREADIMTQGLISRQLTNAVVRSPARAGLVLLDNKAPPDRNAPLPLEDLVDPATLGSKGFAAVQDRGPARSGPTPLATAMVAGLTGPDIDARALLQTLRAGLPATAQFSVAIHEPTAPAWLTGPLSNPQPPPPPPVTPPPVTPPAAAPAPVAAPTAPPAVPQAALVVPNGPPELAALNPADARLVQLALQRLGYYAGKVDGVIGQDSLAAIRRYQHELGADMTGKLTKDQAGRLLSTGK